MLTKKQGLWLSALLLLVLTLLRLFFPGDVPFILDEPLLLEGALKANGEGTWATHGLMGTRGLVYGPLPTWFYQAVYAMGLKLHGAVILKTLLLSVTSAIALLWLATTCNFLKPQLAFVAFLSPYWYFYSRDLWDNSFNIAFSSLAFAAYIAFCKRNSAVSLVIVGLCLVDALLTHLMVLPLALAVAIHFFMFHLQWAKKNWLIIAGVLVVGLSVSYPYLSHLFVHRKASALPFGPPVSLLFPLLGARIFSTGDLSYFYGSWYSGLGWGIVILGLLPYLLSWLGIRHLNGLRNKTDSFSRQVSVFCILYLVLQYVFFYIQGLRTHPHYYNASGILYFFLIWLAASTLWERKCFKPMFAASFAAIGFSTFFLAGKIHTTDGNRESHYGPTLNNLIEVSKMADGLTHDSSLTIEVRDPNFYPIRFNAMKGLYSKEKQPQGEYILRYVREGLGRVELKKK